MKKNVPTGEADNSRKTIYQICDNFFRFWFRILFSNKSRYELIGDEKAAEEIMLSQSITLYMDSVFEGICYEYMIMKAKASQLPIVPDCIGKWWGANQATKKQDDVDILLLDKRNRKAVFYECKYRNVLFDKSEFDNLVTASKAFPLIKTKYYYLFSKSGFTDWIIKEAGRRDDIKLITLDDLFDV